MYKLTSGNMVLDLSFGDGKSRFVPIESWEFKQWLAEGNTPEPEFTPEEEIANAATEAYRSKWNKINSQINALTVTIAANGHKYAANKSAIDDINREISSLDGTETITWYELWGSFQTNKVELQEVVILQGQLAKVIKDQVMGV